MKTELPVWPLALMEDALFRLGGQPTRQRTFQLTLSSVTGASLQVSGNLSAGTIHVSGNVPLDPSGTGSDCDSGVLSWTAQRG